MKTILHLTVGILGLAIFTAAKPEPIKTIPISFNQLLPDTQKQVECLAKNVYYEAGGESEPGKRAVAFVTLNRVAMGFGPDICSVVQQKVKSTCQFSWWCEAKRKINYTKYQESRRIALEVYLNYERMYDLTHGATHFHTTAVRPNWTDLTKTTVIGNHIFYKAKKNTYAKKTKFGVEQQLRSITEFVYAADGGHYTSDVSTDY